MYIVICMYLKVILYVESFFSSLELPIATWELLSLCGSFLFLHVWEIPSSTRELPASIWENRYYFYVGDSCFYVGDSPFSVGDSYFYIEAFYL